MLVNSLLFVRDAVIDIDIGRRRKKEKEEYCLFGVVIESESVSNYESKSEIDSDGDE